MASNPSQQKRLSCVSCRQRKIKCDRMDPCAPCMRAGLKCIFPLPAPPRPRTKPKAKTDQIAHRLSRLEGLVTALGGEEAVAEKAKERGIDISAVTATGPPSNGVGLEGQLPLPTNSSPNAQGGSRSTIVASEGGKYPGNNFWTNLSSEVEELRNLLLDSSLDEDDFEETVTGSSTSHGEQKDSPAPHFMFGFNHAWMDLSHLYPSTAHVTSLLEFYFERFDPVFKILHRPTILSNVGPFVNETNRFATGSGEEVLAFAIFQAAIVTMRPEECLSLLQDERERLLHYYESCVEAALTNADLLNTTSLQTLQGFAIYIVCLRTHQKNRSAWSLVSLLIRIATAMNLNTDGTQLELSTFETEMRRRLWWHILILDVQGAEDRGTTQLIFSYTFDTKMPAELNDEDIDPQHGIIKPSQGFTEMTFGLITFEVAKTYEYVTFSEPKNSAGRRGFRIPSYEEKERKVSEVNQFLHTRFVQHCDLSIPIELKASLVAQSCMLKMWLLLQYPISARGRGTNQRTRASKDQILSSAVSLLEIQHRIETMGGGVSWVSRNWIQWHPLAVVLAELCTQPPGPLVDRAWAIVDIIFEPWSEAVADAKSGPLWRPIRKLMEKARKVHGHTDQSKMANVQDWNALNAQTGIDAGMGGMNPTMMNLHDDSIAIALNEPMQAYNYQNYAGVPPQDPAVQGFEYYQDPAVAANMEPVVWEDWDSFLKGEPAFEGQTQSGSESYRPVSVVQ